MNLFDYDFNNEILVLKSAFSDLPSWTDFLNDLDLNIRSRKDAVKCLHNLGFVTHFGESIFEVKNLIDVIKKIRPNEQLYTAHIYMSLLSTSSTFGWHKDNTDVFYIQAQGAVKWDIREQETVKSVVLEPGDLIYVPKFMYHNTTPLSPRAGISIGFT